MKKRLLALLLAAVMVVSLVPMTVFAEAQKIGDSNVTWELSEGNTVLTLGGTGAMPDFTIGDSFTVDTPWYSAKDTITTLKVGSGITRIGNYAFWDCNNIVNLYIEDLESWCKIEIPGASSYPFYDHTLNHTLYVNGNPVTDLVIPDTITEIKDYAFYNFNNLTSVTIPTSVTSIGVGAFVHCGGLTGITIPTSVTSIGVGAFCYCTALTSVTIPTSVTSIGNTAFGYCTALTSATISSGVTSIGVNAFVSCPKLTSVTIPSSVTGIGARAFTFLEVGDDGCDSLTTVTVKATTPPTLGLGAFPTSNANFKVYVPYGTLTDYQNAAKWKLPTLKPYLAEAYVVDDKPMTHGTVAMSKDCFPSDTYTKANETVNVTVTPDNGYQLKSLKYNDGTDHDITSAKSFTMPTANVTLTAEFEATTYTTWSALQDAITAAPGCGEVPATATTTIQLTGDLTAPEQDGASITIPVGKDITVDLNGHVINANGGAFSVIEVQPGGKLTLIDSDTKTEHYFNVDATTGLWTLTNTKTDKTKTVNGGVITGGNGKNSGGVFVKQNDTLAGKLTMKGGNIVGNTSSLAGGGVYLQKGSTFDMEGGSIIGNITGTGNNSGGGVHLSSASFTMTGGKIEYNVAAGGGGVYSDKGTFTMTDGEIDNNTATGLGLGGGVGIGNGTFTMTGGKISGNNAATNGGGVYYNSGTITLGGTAKITGNTAGSESKTTNNLYLPKNKEVTLGTGTGEGGNGVAAPTSDFSVGVMTQTAPTADTPVQITSNGTADDVKYFTPDSADYEVKYNTDHLELTKTVAPAATYAITNGTAEGYKETNHGYITVDKTSAAEDETVTVTVNPNEGYQLKSLKYNDGEDHTITVDKDGKYTFTMPAYDVTVTAEFEKIHTHNIVKVTGQPATETAAGWSDYYECKDSTDACHKYFEDATAKVEITDLAKWKAQGGKGYIAPLVHSITPVNSKNATDTEAGFKAYYECKNCGKYYEDATGLIEITDIDAWKSQTGKGYIPSGNEINAAKTAAKAALDSENAKDALLDETALTNGKNSIDSAENFADIENAKNAAVTAIQQAQATELANAKTNAKAALDTEEAKDSLTDKTALTNGKNSIDGATTKAAVEAAKNAAITAIQEAQATELAGAKTSAKSALDTEEAKDPLTDKTALTNGKNSIDGATTKAAVEAAKNAAITAIQEAQAGEHKDPKSPETGDTSNMTLWVMLLALSSMGLCACLVLGKKRKKEQ